MKEKKYYVLSFRKGWREVPEINYKKYVDNIINNSLVRPDVMEKNLSNYAKIL